MSTAEPSRPLRRVIEHDGVERVRAIVCCVRQPRDNRDEQAAMRPLVMMQEICVQLLKQKRLLL